jgi:hypothetical protein
MKSATEVLVQTTWMHDEGIFRNHDQVESLDWEKIWAKIELHDYTVDQMVMIQFLGFLDGESDFDLFSAEPLPQQDKIAILEALRIHWNAVEIQENL